MMNAVVFVAVAPAAKVDDGDVVVVAKSANEREAFGISARNRRKGKGRG